MTRLSSGMKAALRAFADDPDEWLTGGQLILNGASTSSLASLKAAGLLERRLPSFLAIRKGWFRLTAEGRTELERIGG